MQLTETSFSTHIFSWTENSITYSRKCSIAPKINWDIARGIYSLQLPWGGIGAHLRSFVNPRTSRLLYRNLPSCLVVAPSFVPSRAACRWRGWYGGWWRRMEERYHHVMQPHHRLRPDQPAVYCLASRDIDPSGVRTRNPEPPDPESEREYERKSRSKREREIGTRWVSAAGGWQPTLVLIQHDSDTASVPSDSAGTQVN